MSMEKTLKEILDEILDEVEQELEEATTTAGVDGYQTPFAFGSGRKKDKKKEKDVATQAGYTLAEGLVSPKSGHKYFQLTKDTPIQYIKGHSGLGLKSPGVLLKNIPGFIDGKKGAYLIDYYGALFYVDLKKKVAVRLGYDLSDQPKLRYKNNFIEVPQAPEFSDWKKYLKESVNEAQKVNPTSKKFLKGMKKIKVRGLGGYMPGVDYVYVDGDKYYFVDFEGDHMELKNISTIKQLHKLHGKSLGESVNEAVITYGIEYKSSKNDRKFKKASLTKTTHNPNIDKMMIKAISKDAKSLAKQDGWVDYRITKDGVPVKESVNEAMKPSQVRSAISKVKKQLMRKWKQKGGYENFGQKELSQMKDKFDYNPYGSSDERQIAKMLDGFDNWAMNYDGNMREGKKRFKRQDGIGKAKYTISYHDGKKKHKDGSDFFDIKIFKNKKDLSDFVGTLVKQGYKPTNESVNEGKVHFEKKLKSGNIFQVIDRDTKGMRGTQDKFSMQIVDKKGKVVKHIGSHPSLSGAKKFSNSINEAKQKRPVNRWLELKNDDTMHPHKKMAMGLKELKYQLKEVEKFFNWYNKIKTMNELDSQNYWKRTNNHIYTIKEKLIKIAKTIQEIEK